MRTPEEIHRYGKEVIEKHCNKLFSLNNGTISEIIDENNQIFRMSDYSDWKYDVIDFIQNHDPDRIDEIESLFKSFEILFTQGDLSKIIGVLHNSINQLRRKEKGVSPDNSQAVQATNEPEPTAANPPKEKKKKFNWKVLVPIVTFLAAVATIIAAVYTILNYYK